jgi:hypothetical protein
LSRLKLFSLLLSIVYSQSGDSSFSLKEKENRVLIINLELFFISLLFFKIHYYKRVINFTVKNKLIENNRKSIRAVQETETQKVK